MLESCSEPVLNFTVFPQFYVNNLCKVSNLVYVCFGEMCHVYDCSLLEMDVNIPCPCQRSLSSRLLSD